MWRVGGNGIVGELLPEERGIAQRIGGLQEGPLISTHIYIYIYICLCIHVFQVAYCMLRIHILNGQRSPKTTAQNQHSAPRPKSGAALVWGVCMRNSVFQSSQTCLRPRRRRPMCELNSCSTCLGGSTSQSSMMWPRSACCLMLQFRRGFFDSRPHGSSWPYLSPTQLKQTPKDMRTSQESEG